jgi:predicted permease
MNSLLENSDGSPCFSFNILQMIKNLFSWYSLTLFLSLNSFSSVASFFICKRFGNLRTHTVSQLKFTYFSEAANFLGAQTHD